MGYNSSCFDYRGAGLNLMGESKPSNYNRTSKGDNRFIKKQEGGC